MQNDAGAVRACRYMDGANERVILPQRCCSRAASHAQHQGEACLLVGPVVAHRANVQLAPWLCHLSVV